MIPKSPALHAIEGLQLKHRIGYATDEHTSKKPHLESEKAGTSDRHMQVAPENERTMDVELD